MSSWSPLCRVCSRPIDSLRFDNADRAPAATTYDGLSTRCPHCDELVLLDGATTWTRL